MKNAALWLWNSTMLRKAPDFALPFARNALLDDPTPEVSVDQPLLGSANGIA